VYYFKSINVSFDQVEGLLDAIARRVLASRANNPAAARKLWVSHVRGILLSGPPGCGNALLACELAQLLGARQPQIVNGPEIHSISHIGILFLSVSSSSTCHDSVSTVDLALSISSSIAL
jgi:hypothetical protein